MTPSSPKPPSLIWTPPTPEAADLITEADSLFPEENSLFSGEDSPVPDEELDFSLDEKEAPPEARHSVLP